MKLSFTTISRVIRTLLAVAVIIIGSWQAYQLELEQNGVITIDQQPVNSSQAAFTLSTLEVKGRAPKTNYSRAQFSNGWGEIQDCDVRNYILRRDLSEVTLIPFTCHVALGTLIDPYSAQTITFVRGPSTSADIQIDHVVALSDAWQKGAQLLSARDRYSLANDPLNLLAVRGDENQAKSDSDAATWLPANKAYRCQYVARQIAVKQKYKLWVSAAEYRAMANILEQCPNQTLPL
ncbi:MAG: HNH endonuclease family protein [Candidatus Saccharimonadales bacterium]